MIMVAFGALHGYAHGAGSSYGNSQVSHDHRARAPREYTDISAAQSVEASQPSAKAGWRDQAGPWVDASLQRRVADALPSAQSAVQPGGNSVSVSASSSTFNATPTGFSATSTSYSASASGSHLSYSSTSVSMVTLPGAPSASSALGVGGAPAAGGAAQQDFSPKAVADRVVDFISKRIEQERAGGASNEALLARLQQGLEGIQKGMAEARDELEARGMFEGEVQDNYFETLGRLQSGMDTLRENLGGTPQATTPQATTPQATAPQATAPQAATPQAATPQTTTPQAATPQATPAPQAPVSSTPVNVPVIKASTSTSGSAVNQAPTQSQAQPNQPQPSTGTTRSNSMQINSAAAQPNSGAGGLGQGVVSDQRQFNLQVTTQDGDVITVNVSSLRGLQAAAEGLGDRTGVMSSDDQYSFDVQGELDDGERQALNDLFAKVNEVAAKFYDGNVEAAFNQAAAIGYDQNELTGFSANMTQTQTMMATQAYAGVAQAGGGEFVQGSPHLSSLRQFAQQIRQAQQELEGSDSPLRDVRALFRELLARLPGGFGVGGESNAAQAPGSVQTSSIQAGSGQATDVKTAPGPSSTTAASTPSTSAQTAVSEQTDASEAVPAVTPETTGVQASEPKPDSVPVAQESSSEQEVDGTATATATQGQVLEGEIVDEQVTENPQQLAWQQFVNTVLGSDTRLAWAFA
ncbi:Hypothetical protein HDN1F_31530 [gamma proteobacterium HdN1]|nr:Hypothetical protein HDN1F_31530 [gamma proteobacterium HdN1]